MHMDCEQRPRLMTNCSLWRSEAVSVELFSHLHLQNLPNWTTTIPTSNGLIANPNCPFDSDFLGSENRSPVFDKFNLANIFQLNSNQQGVKHYFNKMETITEAFSLRPTFGFQKPQSFGR